MPLEFPGWDFSFEAQLKEWEHLQSAESGEAGRTRGTWKSCYQLQILARERGDMAVVAAEQETFEMPE